MALLDKLRAALAESYRVERELGHGGMAVVFLGRDLRHDRDVAIKVLLPELAAAISADRFLREIQIAAQLQHPLILPLFDSGEADGLFYYVMPYVEGESLRDRIRREKRLPVDDAIQIGKEVAEALHYAHEHGVIHRDIKPDNILLSGGHPLIADFGVARAVSTTETERLTGTGFMLGTPHYMSPEQALADPVLDGRSDIYSLGCVIFEMLGGEPPFTGPSLQAVVARHIQQRPPSLRTMRPKISSELEATIETALAKEPGDRFQTGGQFAEALTRPRPVKRPRPRIAARVPQALLAAGAGAVLVIGGWAAWSRWRIPPPISDLIAVAPFDVPDAELEHWSEGVMDLLSRNLNGAGPLRAVSSTEVIRGWSGRADEASTERLARRTRAGIGVFGSVLRSGQDSVRVFASVLDVESRRISGEVQVSAHVARMDRAVDSLTVALLRAISLNHPIGVVQLASIQSVSLPALKAFLQGEQYFRRTAWDSAGAHFERAAELDTTFALALHRIFWIRFLKGTGNDSLIWDYGLQAGRLNRRLAARESLIVTADSLMATILWGPAPVDSEDRARRLRLLATLGVATRRFPDDPEIWYQLGLARNRIGWTVGSTPQQALEAFDRSIALDSTFGPAYVDAIQLSMPVKGAEWTKRYLEGYLALEPTGDQADAARLTANLLNPRQARTPEVERTLDTASAILLYQAAAPLEWWPDSAETTVRLLTKLAARAHDPRVAASPAIPRRMLSMALAWRGHMQEAQTLGGNRPGLFFLQRAMLGGVSPDTAAAVFAPLLRASPWPPTDLAFALPWWAQQGDTASLHEVTRRASPQGREELFIRYLVEAGRAYLALARRDTTEALERFLQLPDPPDALKPDGVGDWDRYVAIQLLAARGKNREAAARLDREVRSTPYALDVLLTFERARVAEGLGDRDRAVAAYTEVANAWALADSQLQAMVAESRAGVDRLRHAPRP